MGFYCGRGKLVSVKKIISNLLNFNVLDEKWYRKRLKPTKILTTVSEVSFVFSPSSLLVLNRKQAFEASLLAQTWKVKYDDIKWPKNKGKLGSRKSVVC